MRNRIVREVDGMSLTRRIFMYRLARHCDELLRQARHLDYPVNRSLQFGNSRGYWILLGVAIGLMIVSQVCLHEQG